MTSRLPRSFFARPTLTVARDLLGQRLVRVLQHRSHPPPCISSGLGAVPGAQPTRRLSGTIIEVEAYTGSGDAASHARRGRTARNAPMFGITGHAYVYFIYGMHWMFNVVAWRDGPGAVLVRALLPLEGVEIMRGNRAGQPDQLLTNGPARLAQALAIDGTLNGVDLCTHPEVFIEPGTPVPDDAVGRGPRVGVTGDELALRRPWRFWLTASSDASSDERHHVGSV